MKRTLRDVWPLSVLWDYVLVLVSRWRHRRMHRVPAGVSVIGAPSVVVTTRVEVLVPRRLHLVRDDGTEVEVEVARRSL